MASSILKSLSMNSKLLLSDGYSIPRLGLGTYNSTGKSGTQTCLFALNNGYRLLDSASVYGNEREVGEAMRRCGLKREDLFIVTKLWDDSHGRVLTEKAFKESLNNFQLDYIDLYLIHSPYNGKIIETWEKMIEIQKNGLVKSIGVSNFGIHHLEQLKKSFPANKPVINQIELSPFLTRHELVEYCKKENISVMAYRPLTNGNQLNNPELMKIANKYSKSTAQILIRWSLQMEFIVIPKSSKEKNILSNSEIFDFNISEEDMATLNSFNKNLCYDWDPTDTQWIS